MDTDQESLLAQNPRSPLAGNLLKLSGNNASRCRKKLFLTVITLSIAVCLTIYFYLNIEAFDGSQSDPGRYKPLSRRKPMLDHESIFSDSGPSLIRLNDLLAHCIVALRIAGLEVVNHSLVHKNKLANVGSKGKTLEGVDDIVTGVDLKSHTVILNTIKDSYRRLNVISEEDNTKVFENIAADEDILPIDRKEFAQLLRSELHEIEGQRTDRSSLVEQQEILVWIDPLDATKEYSENLTNYVTLMACIVYKSNPIAGIIFKPFTNETYWSVLDLPSKKFHHSPDLLNALSISRRDQNLDNIRIIVSRSHAGDIKRLLHGAIGDRASIISAGGSGYKSIEVLKKNADAYVHLTHIKKWDVCAPQAIFNSIKGGSFSDASNNKIVYGDPKDEVLKNGLVATLQPLLQRDLTAAIQKSKAKAE